MSDFHKLKQKTQEGKEWRGTVNVNIDDEIMTLQVRQLTSPELEEVMRLIDRSELKSLREIVPEEIRDEYRDLQSKEELDEEEEERLEELQGIVRDSMGDRTLFDMLGEDTFEGIRRCAIYCVEPDEEDLQHYFRNDAARIESEYGVRVTVPEDVYPAVKDDLEDMVRHSTNFVGFTIGIQVLMETVGDEKN